MTVIISVLFLISLFLNISAYLILIGVHFIGLAYLVVYVSAVSMLFLFVVMLINIRTSELHSNTNKGIPLGFMVSIAFYLPVYNIVSSLKPKLDYDIDVQFVTSNKWDTALVTNTDISSIGNLLYSSHAIWLILAGIILLLALIGTLSICLMKDNTYIEVTAKNI